MKLVKKVGIENTIRKIYNDDKTISYGLLGTVDDFLKSKVLEYCDYSEDTWVFIPFPELPKLKTWFAKTRENLIEEIKTQISR